MIFETKELPQQVMVAKREIQHWLQVQKQLTASIPAYNKVVMERRIALPLIITSFVFLSDFT
ncbi:hypothetical protein F441_02052 [Phytophthora nicotianae CJ01A1]|nr:hypothetical protein PPTG_24521 [Phytophthora nicotianae INRA-310]ETK95076.1 hypothetical protein L915_01987 [Phytophthora nicotianae]ETP25058.1 hypothetical protein F441_02052 [Phytophthora nicotianae CJ01A1]ETL48482.1 hypothetical protein L916_01941 [Phytophthora nicotianae]ETM01553.1 hypothetical protein L917_01895 [Phytophthora nicotianae]ETM54755.1 hypothetical protein L914_01974 [Phytophthora nicotianae]